MSNQEHVDASASEEYLRGKLKESLLELNRLTVVLKELNIKLADVHNSLQRLQGAANATLDTYRELHPGECRAFLERWDRGAESSEGGADQSPAD